jgi:peroxiredoxin
MRTPSIRLCLPTLLAAASMVATSVKADDGSPKARMIEIRASQAEARHRYGTDLNKAAEKAPLTDEVMQPMIDRFLADTRQNMEAALTLAGSSKDDSVTLEAFDFIIRENKAGPGDATARALRMALERGLARMPGIGINLAPISILLFQYPDAEDLLRRVLGENPSHADRGAACYWLTRYLSGQARMVRMFRADPAKLKDYEKYAAASPIAEFSREKDPAALDREAMALLERVVAEFAGVSLDPSVPRLGTLAEGDLFAIRRLAVGNPVPEIEGADHEGKIFRLSELRGKVVVLTFSGNWCGPCVEMYPQERELVARLKGRPFALVCVSTDTAVETLKKSISSGEITWRCWWDGGSGGPIATRWGISVFPSIFVLDEAGIIRYRDVRGDALEKAVASLMGQSAPGSLPAK